MIAFRCLWCALLIITVCSCTERDEWRTDAVVAGNLSQPGLIYTDVKPDKAIPLYGTNDDIYQIDVNQNGFDDLEFIRSDATAEVTINLNWTRTDKRVFIVVDEKDFVKIFDEGSVISAAESYSDEPSSFGSYLYLRGFCDRYNPCSETPQQGNIATGQDNRFIGFKSEEGEVGWIRISLGKNELIVHDYGMLKMPDDGKEAISSFQGKVSLYDIDGNEMWSRHDGVRVEARMGDQVYTDISDAEGIFSFSDIPLGEYSVAFQKEGFSGIDTLLLNNTPNTDQYFGIELAKIPTIQTELLSAEYTSDTSLFKIVTNIESRYNESHWTKMVFFFSRSPNVSKTEYNIREWTNLRVQGNKLIHKEFTVFPPYQTRGLFASGEKIYIALYPANHHEIYYPKSRDNQKLYFAYGQKSNVIEFVVP